MTGTSTAGAEWKGVGELKTLKRIVGGAEDDEDVSLPAVGHNRPSYGAVHETTAAEIALEDQAQIVERAFAEAEGMYERVGRELLKLREKFCHVELGRRAHIITLRAEGLSIPKISAQLGVSTSCVWQHLNNSKKGIEPILDNKAAARFLTWAQARFKRARSTIRHYMSFARQPARVEARLARQSKERLNNRHIGRLAKAIRDGEIKVAPTVFKQAVLALGERGSPVRVSVLRWYISVEVGSDDPQEIARWFAKLG